MRALLVVVSAPSLQLFPRVGKRQEPVRVHALGPHAAVERLGEGVVGGLSRAREVERNALGVGSQIEVARDELAALVDPDGLRIAHRPADPFERGHDILAPVAEADVERQ